MLVLSRRKNEQVIISVPPSEVDTTITVTVIENKDRFGEKIRLGFSAPQKVRIDRYEIYRKKEEENERWG